MLSAANVARKPGGKIIGHARDVIKDHQIKIIQGCANRHGVGADQFAHPPGPVGNIGVRCGVMHIKGSTAEGIKQGFKVGECPDLDLNLAPVEDDLLFRK